MSIVRVRESVAVQHPDLPGEMIALRENDPYDDDDILVRTYRWAFAADIEQATSAPGEKRGMQRR